MSLPRSADEKTLKESRLMRIDKGKMSLPSGDESTPTRQSLLARLKNWEDKASWQDFFDTYWKLIYGVARRSGLKEAEAQDAVQETVLAVVRNIGRFEYDPARCSFKSWLMLITQQRIIWQLRKRVSPASPHAVHPSESTAPGTDEIERIPDPASLDLTSVWDEEWQKNLFSAALERVKKKVRARQFQLFDLYVLQEWKAEEVARTLHVSVMQVYLAKHRISKLLAKEVQDLNRSPAAK